MALQWVTIEDAAAQLGITVMALKAQVSSSALIRKEIGGAKKWCIDPHVLARLKSQKQVREWRAPKSLDDKPKPGDKKK